MRHLAAAYIRHSIKLAKGPVRVFTSIHHHEDNNQDHPAKGLPGNRCIDSATDSPLTATQVEVEETENIGALKAKIEESHGHSVSSQKIIYAGMARCSNYSTFRV